jgi:hypothetical protein
MKLLSSDAVTKVQRLELESSFDDYFYSGYRGMDFFRVLESVTFRLFPVVHALRMPKICCEFLNEWLPKLSTLILKNIFICFSDHEDSDPIGILKDFYTFGIAARQLLYLQ